MNTICCDNFASAVLYLLAHCWLQLHKLVSQCVVYHFFLDSYEKIGLLAKTHEFVTRQVGVNMLCTHVHSLIQNTVSP